MFKEDNSMIKYMIYFPHNQYESTIEKCCKKFLGLYVCFDEVENEIYLHKIFNIYIKDFGNVEKTIEWICLFLKSLGDSATLKKGLKEGSIFVNF